MKREKGTPYKQLISWRINFHNLLTVFRDKFVRFSAGESDGVCIRQEVFAGSSVFSAVSVFLVTFFPASLHIVYVFIKYLMMMK